MTDVRIVECEFACNEVKSRAIGPFSYVCSYGELRFASGEVLRRPMPLKKGLAMAPGVYRVLAQLAPLYKILSAELIPVAG